jgi:hypothetical protein
VRVGAAPAAGRTTTTAWGARCRARTARRGRTRAAVAIGHALLIRASELLRHRDPDHESSLRRTDAPRHRSPDHLVEQLRALGFDVSRQPISPAA